MVLCTIVAAGVGKASAEEPFHSWVWDNYFAQVQSVAALIQLDVGPNDNQSQGWATRGTPPQREHREAVIAIVKYCVAQAQYQFGDIPDSVRNYPSLAASAQQSYDHVKLNAWVACNGAEAAAYRRLVAADYYRSEDRSIVIPCTKIPDRASFAAIEACIKYEIARRNGK